MSNRDYSVPAVEKALDILFFLKNSEHAQSTLTEIASGLGLNKSSCLMILRTLQARNLIRVDENSRKYSLGLGFLELAAVVTDQVSHISLAKPVIERLAQETHLTLFTAKRVAQDTVMILDKAEFREIAYVSFPIGQRRPITAGATGKVYLAFMDEAERESILAETGPVQYTPATITDHERLAREICQVRTSGYSVNFGEYTIGINGVAAPVFDQQANVATTITAVGFPQALHAGNIHSIGQRISAAACQLTLLLQGRFPESLTRPAKYSLSSDQFIEGAVQS